MVLFSGDCTTTTGMSQKGVPLPTEVEIIAPSLTVSPQVAALSGKWKGMWDGGLDSILIVEEIGPQKAKVIYAWGDSVWSGESGIKQGYRRYVAKVIPGPPAQIEFGGGGYAKISFEMGKDLNSIKGLWESASGGCYSGVIMKRIAK